MIPAWPDYRDHHQFMRFGIGKSPDIVVQTDFLPDRMEFWEKLLLINVSWSAEPEKRDTITDGPPDDTFPDNPDTIDCKLTIYLVLLIIAMLTLYYSNYSIYDLRRSAWRKRDGTNISS